MISASTGDGVADLKAALAARVPEGPWHFPEDQVSDATDRMMAAEVTREQLYLQLHAELPYASAIETEKYEERKDGSVASTSRSWSAATARKRSCSAKAAREIQRHRRGGAGWNWPRRSAARSTSSCTSRSTRNGRKIGGSIARSGSTGWSEPYQLAPSTSLSGSGSQIAGSNRRRLMPIRS